MLQSTEHLPGGGIIRRGVVRVNGGAAFIRDVHSATDLSVPSGFVRVRAEYEMNHAETQARYEIEDRLIYTSS